MHEIVIHIVGLQPCKLLGKIPVKILALFDQIMREFCRDADLLPALLLFYKFSETHLAAGIHICRVEIIDSCLQRNLHFALCFLLIDRVAVFGIPHATISEDGKFIVVSFVCSVMHDASFSSRFVCSLFYYCITSSHKPENSLDMRSAFVSKLTDPWYD